MTSVKVEQLAQKPNRAGMADQTAPTNDCCDDVLWTCTSCGCRFTYQDEGDGGLPGSTPIKSEFRCPRCRGETVALCEDCGRGGVLEAMTPIQDGVLCERCAV